MKAFCSLVIIFLLSSHSYSQLLHIESDATWLASIPPQPGWETIGFNDSGWALVEFPNANNAVIGNTACCGPNSGSMWVNPYGVYALFRKSFSLSTGNTYQATIQINADDEYFLYFDGQIIGCDFNWGTAETYTICNISSGNHVIAILATDSGGSFEGCAVIADFDSMATPCNPTVIPVCTSPLPIRWLEFDGYEIEKGNKLFWKTTDDNSNYKFVVERSKDANQFYQVGEDIFPVKDSQNIHEYKFIDSLNIEQNQYYRIKQIDYDGNFFYSKTIQIRRVIDNNLEVKIYPNPTDNIINIAINNGNKIIIQWALINYLGETVKIGFIDGVSEPINTENLVYGIYYLRLNAEGQIITSRIVKK